MLTNIRMTSNHQRHIYIYMAGPVVSGLNSCGVFGCYVSGGISWHLDISQLFGPDMVGLVKKKGKQVELQKFRSPVQSLNSTCVEASAGEISAISVRLSFIIFICNKNVLTNK